MSRASYGRDVCFPLGYKHSGGARAANVMVSRVMLLMGLAINRGLVAILEQPTSSLMQHHSRFQQLIRSHSLWLSKHCLGNFLGESQKPIMLFCNFPFLGEINLYRSRLWVPRSDGVATHYTDDHGVKRSTGASGLKDTQSYPRPFGRAVARVYDDHRADVLVTVNHTPGDPIDLDVLFGDCADTWDDANLHGVLSALSLLVKAQQR
jgi:hypothetical protein